MKFKFSLEKLLSHRKTLEDVARRDFNEAQNRLDRETQVVEHFREELVQAYKQRFVIQVSGGAVTPELTAIEDYMNGKKISIQRHEKIIEGLKKILEEKRKRLVEAAQEHKIMQKLREKRKTEYVTQLKKHENKLMDELIVTHSKRGNTYE